MVEAAVCSSLRVIAACCSPDIEIQNLIMIGCCSSIWRSPDLGKLLCMRDDPLLCGCPWFVGLIDGCQWALAALSSGLESSVWGKD